MLAKAPFSGSYTAADVEFLLTPITLADTPIAVKEALIQSGQMHYSQLLTHEKPPSEAYLTLFHQAMALNQQRMAAHVLLLAEHIVATRQQGITLVSLARAGTPVGVLLKHVLARYFAQTVKHYSISIVRDVGIDANALRFILQHHAPETLVFVDGWTGKGVIARQLATSLAAFAQTDHVTIPAELYVLADLSGSAAVAASADDYLIPSCILNATISGLVSRSIYDQSSFHPTDFHGCVFYQHLAAHDLSGYFITTMLASIAQLRQGADGSFPLTSFDRVQCQHTSQQLLTWLTKQYGISHHNYIKPGIGEATRVLLRREARRLLLQNLDAEDTQHLCWLANSRSIPIDVVKDLPYRAVALIKEMPL